MSERRAEPKSSTLRVKLRYPDVDTFLVKFGPNISRGGVFIATKTPRAVGTPLRFEFVLLHNDAEIPAFRGEGVVHFVRDVESAGPKQPAGMGVKFTRLPPEALALVDRVLTMRAAAAGPSAPPEPTGPMPAQVREVTGEVEVVTGPVAQLEPQMPPDVPPPDSPQTLPADAVTAETPLPPPRHMDEAPTSTADVDALLDETGVSRDRVELLLRTARAQLSAEAAERELDSLLQAREEQSATKDQALAELDVLLRRR